MMNLTKSNFIKKKLHLHFLKNHSIVFFYFPYEETKKKQHLHFLKLLH